MDIPSDYYFQQFGHSCPDDRNYNQRGSGEELHDHRHSEREERKKSVSEYCDEAISDLEDCARQMYADAVVAVSFSVTETGGEKHRRCQVLAYGTAVSFLDR